MAVYHSNYSNIPYLKEQIKPFFDILRKETLSADEYSIVLLIMTFHRYNFFDGLHQAYFTKEEILSPLEERIKYSSAETAQLKEVYEVFKPSMNKLSSYGLLSLFDYLKTIDAYHFDVYFSEYFEVALQQIAELRFRKGDEFLQPYELTRLLLALANLSGHCRVFNPYAGAASFSIPLDYDISYYGQEINSHVWALGVLRILAHRKMNAVLDTKNSIYDWPELGIKYDLVIANPPFNLRLKGIDDEYLGHFKHVEEQIIARAIEYLTANGKLILVLPTRFLFGQGWERTIRKRLVEDDLIDTVIHFPSGLLQYTSVVFCAIIISKVKDHPGTVRFIDSSPFVDTVRGKEKILNDQALFNDIAKMHKSVSTRYADLITIKENDYNFSVNRYFQHHYTGVELKNILLPLRGERPDRNVGRIVRISNLKDDNLDFILEAKNLREEELQHGDFTVIKESALLVAMRWKNLKPTYFKYESESILLTGNIKAFTIDPRNTDIQYLINELHADYVLEQLGYNTTTVAMPFLRMQDLLQIKVLQPPLAEQKAKAAGLSVLREKLISLQAERNALARGQSVKTFNEFASLKHTLGRPRQNILDWSDNLLDFFKDKEGEFEKLNMEFKDFYQVDIMDALTEIKRDIGFMTKVLEKGERGLVLSEHALTLISLHETNNIIKQTSNNGFNFRIKFTLVKHENLKSRGIEANPELLKTLLDNILTNANKHGFSNDDLKNEVLIDLIAIEDKLILEVKNNGKPFPQNFTKDMFITKFSTADQENGQGLGGYDINRIAEYFGNPDWQLLVNEDTIYPVGFRFEFNIKPIL